MGGEHSFFETAEPPPWQTKVLHGKEELSESDLDKLKAEFKSGVFDDGKREFREDVASIDHREEVPQEDQDQSILLPPRRPVKLAF
jgi:hypothetical protein